jgi:hypothetical protein
MKSILFAILIVIIAVTIADPDQWEFWVITIVGGMYAGMEFDD